VDNSYSGWMMSPTLFTCCLKDFGQPRDQPIAFPLLLNTLHVTKNAERRTPLTLVFHVYPLVLKFSVQSQCCGADELDIVTVMLDKQSDFNLHFGLQDPTGFNFQVPP
jgi:hypothetical protein